MFMENDDVTMFVLFVWNLNIAVFLFQCSSLRVSSASTATFYTNTTLLFVTFHCCLNIDFSLLISSGTMSLYCTELKSL